jgi:hypothetical protein
MWLALQKLGYKTYHFKEVGTPENIKERHVLCWREALIAKLYSSGKPYGKAEFDKILKRYNVRHITAFLEKNFPLTSSIVAGCYGRSLRKLLR